MKLIREPQSDILGWAGAYFNTTFQQPCSARGIIDNQGQLVGAVVFNCLDARNVEMTIVAKHALTPTIARQIFGLAFGKLNARRISLTMREKDVDTIRKALRWGFVIEGRKRDYYDTDHAIILGMTRSECRFLERPHGKHITRRAA